jgi:hypothetical protein
MYRFETVAGAAPELNRVTFRSLIWSLASPQHPELTLRHVGAWPPAVYRAAMTAAGELIGAREKAENSPATQSEPAPGWIDLWAAARARLGLAEAEFWSLSPAMLEALWAKFDEDRQDRIYGHAMTCAAIYNANRASEEAPVLDAELFMPGSRGEAAARRMAQEQRQALKDKMASFAAVIGGKK